MAYYFISDLHLAENRPDMTQAFFDFLADIQAEAEALFILGDFFSFWIGDDDTSDWLIPVKSRIKQASEAGLTIYFMPGNRDFALGQTFCKETGMQFLSDPTIVNLYQDRILLAHGDAFCTDDVDYQRYRKVIQHPLTLFVLRALPLSWRLKIAQKLRASSKEKQQMADQNILDVNLDTVSDAMDAWQVDLLIHGHTHKPKIHNNARSSARGTRIVLGDWYEQGSYLELSQDGFQLFSLTLPKLES
ncbi:UDP-2,3-diacylglucosamine diphosphatase [Catenovulum sp. SM1970]|uniref:UDP-2,3-diacylglucosamine diphosphatase n=1 Tax=Marinifaba aquimaris TaxID=2741323 RepID=UPI00157273CA|nr:UDP-2,3-diacylglucosamine diphosphatase [Marinifaba aquimaris]NTS76452.1 UDP-2,3-diacylglucosamine diphosphatase [Marinifaba aquimaris]